MSSGTTRVGGVLTCAQAINATKTVVLLPGSRLSLAPVLFVLVRLDGTILIVEVPEPTVLAFVTVSVTVRTVGAAVGARGGTVTVVGAEPLQALPLYDQAVLTSKVAVPTWLPVMVYVITIVWVAVSEHVCGVRLSGVEADPPTVAASASAADRTGPSPRGLGAGAAA